MRCQCVSWQLGVHGSCCFEQRNRLIVLASASFYTHFLTLLLSVLINLGITL